MYFTDSPLVRAAAVVLWLAAVGFVLAVFTGRVSI